MLVATKAVTAPNSNTSPPNGIIPKQIHQDSDEKINKGMLAIADKTPTIINDMPMFRLTLRVNLYSSLSMFYKLSISFQIVLIWSKPYRRAASSIRIHWKNCKIKL